MKSAAFALVIAAGSLQAVAQTADGGVSGAAGRAAPTTATGGAPDRSPAEPNVKHVVIEDELSRIEELRVRGLTRRITVQPKGGQAAYEIVPADPGRDASDAGRTTPGGGGQRVWPVLKF